jgi:acyl carrier protein
VTEVERIHALDKLILHDETVDVVNELCDFTDLLNDLAYDSLSLVQLIVSVESLIGAEIDEDEILVENLRNYGWWQKVVLSTEWECVNE